MSAPLFRQLVASMLEPKRDGPTVILTREGEDALLFLRSVVQSGPYADATDDAVVSAVLVAYAGFMADAVLFTATEGIK